MVAAIKYMGEKKAAMPIASHRHESIQPQPTTAASNASLASSAIAASRAPLTPIACATELLSSTARAAATASASPRRSAVAPAASSCSVTSAAAVRAWSSTHQAQLAGSDAAAAAAVRCSRMAVRSRLRSISAGHSQPRRGTLTLASSLAGSSTPLVCRSHVARSCACDTARSTSLCASAMEPPAYEATTPSMIARLAIPHALQQ
mmetsp:Transcript_33954/g.93282  ORF Transcript_33954/g.93282 Transcript_33954/m.93282 type:complete len:205 (+) Transcript_33954:178-792(+)